MSTLCNWLLQHRGAVSNLLHSNIVATVQRDQESLLLTLSLPSLPGSLASSVAVAASMPYAPKTGTQLELHDRLLDPDAPPIDLSRPASPESCVVVGVGGGGGGAGGGGEAPVDEDAGSVQTVRRACFGLGDPQVIVGGGVLAAYRASLASRTKNELVRLAHDEQVGGHATAAIDAAAERDSAAVIDLLVQERKKRLEARSPNLFVVGQTRMAGEALGVWMRGLGLWHERWRLAKELDKRRAALYAQTWQGRVDGWCCCVRTNRMPTMTIEQWYNRRGNMAISLYALSATPLVGTWVLINTSNLVSSDTYGLLILMCLLPIYVTLAGSEFPSWAVILREVGSVDGLDALVEDSGMELTTAQKSRFQVAVASLMDTIPAISATFRWLWHPLAFGLYTPFVVVAGLGAISAVPVGFWLLVSATNWSYNVIADCACVYDWPPFTVRSRGCICEYTANAAILGTPISSSNEYNRDDCCAACEHDHLCVASNFFAHVPENITKNCWLHAEYNIVPTADATVCKPPGSRAIIIDSVLEDALSGSSLWVRLGSIALPALKVFLTAASGFGGVLAVRAVFDPRGAAVSDGATKRAEAEERTLRHEKIRRAHSLPLGIDALEREPQESEPEPEPELELEPEPESESVPPWVLAVEKHCGGVDAAAAVMAAFEQAEDRTAAAVTLPSKTSVSHDTHRKFYKCVQESGVATRSQPTQVATRSTGPYLGDIVLALAVVQGKAGDGSVVPYLQLASGGYCAMTLPGMDMFFEHVSEAEVVALALKKETAAQAAKDG
eukprot:COSAG02_NODE_3012_length_7552_cov_13.461827_1_plen_782_part_10